MSLPAEHQARSFTTMVPTNSVGSEDPQSELHTRLCNETVKAASCGEVCGTYGFVGTFLLACILIVIIVTSFFGNGLIFVVCYKKPKLMTIAHKYILHLAICQFAMTVGLMPLSLVSVFTKSWPQTGTFFCHLEGFLKPFLFTAMVLTLLLISWDRYVSITRPLHYRSSFIVTYWTIMIGAVWALSVAIAVPSIIGWNDIVYKPYQFACVADHNCRVYGYVMYRLILGFAVPFAVMGAVYFRIYLEARKLMQRYKTLGAHGVLSKSQKNSTEESTKGKDEKWALNEWRVAKTGIVVVGTYFLCWVPFFIVLMGGGRGRPIWVTISSFMGFGICSINPYVYVFRSRSMRKQATALFMKMLGRGEMLSDSETPPTGAFTMRESSVRSNSSRKSNSRSGSGKGKIYKKVPRDSVKSQGEKITDIPV